MKNIILSGILLIALSQLSFGQTLNGLVVSEEKNEPVPLANIGILNAKAGTYTNDEGAFSLELSGEAKNDILVVSAIGYEGQRISLEEINIEEQLEITLSPKEYELGSFTVEDSRLKTKRVGNRLLPVLNMAWTADGPRTRIGKAIAIKIQLRHNPPIRINEASIGVYENPWQEARYRLRIMNIDSTGEPGEDIINLNKTITMTEEKGWVNFNFANDAPVLTTNEFFLVAENIDTSGVWRNPDGPRSLFPIFMFNAVTLSKQSVYLSNEGLQQWERKPKDPTFRLKYAYE